jgi:hypothetical protein
MIPTYPELYDYIGTRSHQRMYREWRAGREWRFCTWDTIADDCWRSKSAGTILISLFARQKTDTMGSRGD